MKITITGHSAGIGKALSGLYPEHIGFSRTNGFDISIPEHRAMILSQSKDSDVFVNNAHDLDHQTMMFEEVFEECMKDYFVPAEAKQVSPVIPLSPMPGGVGPMTRAMLLTNVVDACS